MHWLLMRPAVGWGAFLLIHAIGIPLVYVMGKSCGMRKAQGQHELAETQAVDNTH